MPIHDWTRIPSGLFHDFHQAWTIQIRMALNAGLLPKGFSALVEQKSKGWEPDVLAIDERRRRSSLQDEGGLLILDPPSTHLVFRTEEETCGDRANRIVVKHHLGRTVAIIEIVSPGNKDSETRLSDFVEKIVDFIRNGIHVLIVDLFPASARDEQGIHPLIWSEFKEDAFRFPEGKDRTLVSYEAGREKVAYVEPMSVGDPLPGGALFLAAGKHLLVPLESTYQSAWNGSSEALREAVETGLLPEDYPDDSENEK